MFFSSPDVALAQRIEYLSRAVASLRSADVGCMPRLGLLLRDLEDLLDVARIQNKVSISLELFIYLFCLFVHHLVRINTYIDFICT